MPAIYPSQLSGLAFNSVRRPKGSTNVQQLVTGREDRLGLWTYPLYEWDLTYSVLHDFQQWPTSIPSELKRLEGFFLAMQGSLTPFLFLDPDDNTVVGQQIGIGDGTTTAFLLVRTYGDPSYGVTVTEPVGFPSSALGAFNVYLNGGLIPLTAYTVTGNPTNYVVTFASAPGAGVVVTVDMSYFFWVRFKDDSLEFDKFSGAPGAGFWAVKKLTLSSLRIEGTTLPTLSSPPPPPAPPPPPPPPIPNPVPAMPIVTFVPKVAFILDTTPLGTVVATFTVAMSDGSPFVGTVMFGPPNNNDGGRFVITGPGLGPGPYSLVLNAAGSGLPLSMSLENITIIATQP